MTADTPGKNPVTSSTFYVLLALSDRIRHGLGIVDEIERRTGGEVVLGPGTLYNAIKRMVEEGLIEESDERPEPDEDDSRRRYYRITDRGREVLEGEASRLATILDVVHDKAILPRSRG